MQKKYMRICIFVCAGLITPSMSQASEPELAVSNIALAQELTNPLADLMTIPIQMNFDDNYGVDDAGSKITTNIQPVVPFKMGKDWNLITRTIIPLVHQDEVVPGTGTQSGLGDINLQLFLSPRKATSSGLIWGAGAVLYLPTATDSLIGAKTVSYTHLTLPTNIIRCRSRWSPYH